MSSIHVDRHVTVLKENLLDSSDVQNQSIRIPHLLHIWGAEVLTSGFWISVAWTRMAADLWTIVMPVHAYSANWCWFMELSSSPKHVEMKEAERSSKPCWSAELHLLLMHRQMNKKWAGNDGGMKWKRIRECNLELTPTRGVVAVTSGHCHCVCQFLSFILSAHSCLFLVFFLFPCLSVRVCVFGLAWQMLRALGTPQNKQLE